MKQNKEPKLYYIYDKSTNELLVKMGISSLSAAVRELPKWMRKGYDVMIKDQYGKVYVK